ncbi:MMPL family transporter [Streptomyces sp. NPDC051020]|uniref:MMPL family transporter n=1 Tax=Streptomyces sp. NPDC051020 TaxID=3155409 RepID=UPI00341BAE73
MSLPIKSAERLTGALTGRVSKWVVVVLWLLTTVALVPLAGRLAGAQNDDITSWLPNSAESTRVAERAEDFPGGDTLTGVIVYVRPAGLTEADRAAVAAERTELAGLSSTPVTAPVASEDGKALMISLRLPSDIKGKKIEELRTSAAEGLPDGLESRFTGGAGARLDSLDAFSGIDSTLLLVAGGVVALLLIVTYRSPVLWLLPLLCVGIVSQLANAVAYLLAEHAGMVVTSQSAAILLVLVFGAGTDYALLLLSRYREELTRHEDKHVAMAVALRRAGPAIVASGATVALGVLCLLAAELNSNSSLGPVAVVGVLCALLAMLTLLPALLVVCGRWLFWPVVPRFAAASARNTAPAAGRRSFWGTVSRLVSARPRLMWVTCVLAFVALAVGGLGMKTGLAPADTYTTKPDSVIGQQLLAKHYPAGSARPLQVIANAGSADTLRTALTRTDGVDSVAPPVRSEDGSKISLSVILTDAPGSKGAQDSVDRVREAAHGVSGADALVGGSTATDLDVSRAQAHDRRTVPPMVLAVVLLVLILLLRSLVAPLLLMATVIVSFGAALGLSWLIFHHLLGYPAVDSSLFLFGFLFLVALGVDYNIFLVHRIREETAAGVTPDHRGGVLRALTSTGGVITSAGAVLAATFAALAVLPLVAMVELGLLVALGVVLDTFVVRSLVVSSIALDLGDHFWWPVRRGASPSPAKDGTPSHGPGHGSQDDDAARLVGTER